MTYIVFSFDTEDYVNPHAADGILRCAEILRSEGIRGCFNVVAKLAEALVKWGRQDVIDALTEAGIRENVKVMIGGAPVTQAYADEIGADAYTKDAASAAETARNFMVQ